MQDNTDFVLRTFYDPNESKDISLLLNNSNLENWIIVSERNFDHSRLNAQQNLQYELIISKNDLQKAEEILFLDAELLISEITPDYYLFSFTDEELIAILKNADEWSINDFLLARNLLNQKGYHFSDEDIQQFKLERRALLAEPEKVKKVWIILAYCCAFFACFLGLLIGWSYYKTKKNLPDGEKVFNYSEKDREHGFIIFLISLCNLILSFFLSLLRVPS